MTAATAMHVERPCPALKSASAQLILKLYPSLPLDSLLRAAAKLDEVSRKISVLTSFSEKPEEAAPTPASGAAVDGEEGGEDVYADGLDDSEGAGQQ
jgi:hypothetical protein